MGEQMQEITEKGQIEVVLYLNARLQPVHRDELYGNRIDELLQEFHMGFVTGGGCLQDKSGEIKSCNIEIVLTDEKYIDKLQKIVELLGAPDGSYLDIEQKRCIDIGKQEGLAVYLNGTDLDEEIYHSCDVNYVIAKLEETVKSCGRLYSYWEGNKETALYFYGNHFQEMQEKMQPFLEEYPLCKKCRVVRIA